MSHAGRQKHAEEYYSRLERGFVSNREKRSTMAEIVEQLQEREAAQVGFQAHLTHFLFSVR